MCSGARAATCSCTTTSSAAPSPRTPPTSPTWWSTGTVPTGCPSRPPTASADDPSKPSGQGRQVILTSGTTGVPKGASRSKDKLDLVAATALFERVPFRAFDVHAVPAPMFHSLGNAALLAGATLSHTLVLSRRFDPQPRCSARSPSTASERSPRCRSCSSASSPSPTTRSRARHVQPRGRVLLGLGAARLARHRLDGPLRRQPLQHVRLHRGRRRHHRHARRPASGAGNRRPSAAGVDVRLYDDHDRRVTGRATTGRIFVGSGLRFEGYTGGADQAGRSTGCSRRAISATGTTRGACSSAVATTT